VPRNQRLALLALAAVVAIVAAVLLRPGGGGKQSPTQRSQGKQTGSSARPTPRAPGESEPRPAPGGPRATTIRVRDGRPVGGAGEITVKSGDTVRLAFESNSSDRLHIHGYDRYVQLQPGRTVRVSFPAKLEGVFDIESHSTEAKIASLTIEP